MIIRGYIFLLITIIILQGCVEPFDFVVENQQSNLVIESQISDVSFSKTLLYPSDGRYFEVTLRRTNDVTNRRDEVVSNALITLTDDLGMQWVYTESMAEPGKYFLYDNDFKAEVDRKYRLIVQVTDDEAYQSSWEQLPASAPLMGDICFEESEVFKYVVEAGEEVLRSIPVVQVGVELPGIDRGNAISYRWDFEPMWIYNAPLASSAQSDKICWATNVNYLSDYTLQLDNEGGYNQDLFFIEVPVNERILSDFSVLIRQFSLDEDYYTFWDDLKKQTERGSIFDAPPYNLQTNFESTTGDQIVSGYFGVAQEQAQRWYFNHRDLSYYNEDYLLRICSVPCPGCPAEECLSCLAYTNGVATNIEPVWWRK
ncbi:MAG: hypothetical protein DHS20C17_15140 [Cyclobacteriaceae bacterium]|nr:MAG: hypothetical protein DHS20C17_15140 [Cyclobacteriaceae bacterium]